MEINHKLENLNLANRSGNIEIEKRLTSFLYELMRDHLPCGVVEELVRNSEIEPDVSYCNGWLAQYADDLANRMLK